MRHRTIDNPVPRNLDGGRSHRKIAVDLILERLHPDKPETDLRRVSEMLGRRQRLHDQPWRRARRRGAESASTMELIRRYEAKLKAH
jgi:hypothetical protein